MRRRTGCPVVIAPKRAQAAKLMAEQHPKVDVIICDDGLQHYALKRDIELIMIDAERGTGNGWLCLRAHYGKAHGVSKVRTGLFLTMVVMHSPDMLWMSSPQLVPG